MRISGKVERWAFPYRVNITSDLGGRLLRAEVISRSLEFQLDDMQGHERWRSKIEYNTGFLGWLKSPNFVMYREDDCSSRVLLRKSGWMQIRADWKQNSAWFSFATKEQAVECLDLRLRLGREDFTANFGPKAIQTFPPIVMAGILYYVWLRFTVISES